MLKRFISLLLSVLFIISAFSGLSFTGSALELDDDKIYVKVEDQYYEVEKGDVFTYEYKLKYTDAKISSVDTRIFFDPSALKFVPDVDEYGDYDMLTMFPVMGNSVVYNFKKSGELLFNFSKMSGVRFMSDDSKVFCGRFEVTADVPGVYEINGYFETLADTELNRIVYQHVDLLEYTEVKSITDVPVVEESTTATDEPTNDDVIVPTGPDGTAPTETEPTEPKPTETEPQPTETEPTEPQPTETEPTEKPTEAPKVENLKAIEIKEGSVTVVWDAVDNASKYWLYRNGVAYSSTGENTYVFSGLTAGTTYELSVAAVVDGAITERATISIKTLDKPEPIAQAGYYLVGTLDGQNCWFVDANSADRMFKANESAQGEYMLDWTFSANDEIKVVYFDGYEIKTWYKDGGDNYKISADEVGKCTVYFRAEGNASWSYTYLYVAPEVVPTEPQPTVPQPTEPKPTEPEPTEPQPTETEPTEPEPTEPEPTEPEPTEPKPTEPKPTETEPTEPEPTEPQPTEPKPTEPKPTEPQPIAQAGYYLVGTLDGQNCWFVDANSADRMFKENEGAQGEYMIDWTFSANDEIKVVYFDGNEIKTWYKDGGDNYKIATDEVGKCTVYFRAEGNASWSYTYLYVAPEVVPTEPQPTEPKRALGDVNGDGKVDILDATAIQRHEAFFDRLSDEQLLYADTNKDGVVSILDATMIQRLVALFITEF